VARELAIPRGLVALDPELDEEHARSADRDGVILELRYSQLAVTLEADAVLANLTAGIEEALVAKNRQREGTGERSLPGYYRQYALLQEVTKAASRRLCGGEITIAHTAARDDISPFSVTSFYEVGLSSHAYAASDLLTFDG